MRMASEYQNVVASMDTVTRAEVEKAGEAVAEKAVDFSKVRAQDLPGVTAPFGFWDPMGFSTKVSRTGKLLFYREAELKHGRVCMLASLGILVGEKFHPLFGGNIDVPAYRAFQETPLQRFWWLVAIAVSIPEMFSVFTFDTTKGRWLMRTDREPGDFNWDPLNLKPTDPKELRDLQDREINNGRLAMLAAAGMILQEVATGEKIFK